MGHAPRRADGTLTSWNDDRGFGFITPVNGGENVFAHITAFAPGDGRPKLGAALSFEVEIAEGKRQAVRVRSAGRSPAIARNQQAPQSRTAPRSSRPVAGRANYLAIVVFVVGLGAVNVFWPVSIWVIGVYVLASVVCFIAYAVDKSRAQSGGWRVSEKTLHTLEFLGGWPGAIVAQQVLRHKTRKASFRSAFWVSVVANLLVFALVTTPIFALVTAPAFRLFTEWTTRPPF
ncbi:DUF1294 domain-containing protein [Cryobacterium sp. MLB-32]|uniref:DUF1294 domain-containing protein n=1 Tax=Cryobacterium sp. MLB-32 TaxID=1529318 RepID=UPI00068A0572|nr:DUF1294 domain-containing protein [Cryobacterium sp. MLB-32]